MRRQEVVAIKGTVLLQSSAAVPLTAQAGRGSHHFVLLLGLSRGRHMLTQPLHARRPRTQSSQVPFTAPGLSAAAGAVRAPSALATKSHVGHDTLPGRASSAVRSAGRPHPEAHRLGENEPRATRRCCVVRHSSTWPCGFRRTAWQSGRVGSEPRSATNHSILKRFRAFKKLLEADSPKRLEAFQPRLAGVREVAASHQVQLELQREATRLQRPEDEPLVEPLGVPARLGLGQYRHDALRYREGHALGDALRGSGDL